MGWARVSNLKSHPPTHYPPRPGPDAQSNKLRPRRVKWGATEASLQSRARSGPQPARGQSRRRNWPPPSPIRKAPLVINAPSLTVT